MNSKMYSASQMGYKSQLGLFTLPQTNVGVIDSNYTTIFPLNSFLDNVNPIKFVVYSPSDYYEPSSACIYLELAVVKADGTNLVATDNIAVVNNLAAALFENCEVTVNNTPTVKQNVFYQYKYHLQDMVYLNSPLEKTNLKLQLYYPDNLLNTFSSLNAGFMTRKSICTKSNQFECLVRIADAFCFRQPRLLLPDNHLQITLRRSSAPFCLDGDDPRTNKGDAFPYRLIIKDCYLNIKRYTLHPDLVKQHQAFLEAGNRANYPLKINDVKMLTIAKDTLQFQSEVLYSGKLPKFILVSFAKSDAVSGSLTASPFVFKNFDLEYASINVEGDVQTYKKIDLSNNKKFLAYLAVQNLFAKYNSKFSLDSMDLGSYFICFELAPDLNSKTLHTTQTGQLRLFLKYKNKTSENVNCILFSESEGLLQIGKNYETWSDGLID